jgi:hypothetical protein
VTEPSQTKGQEMKQIKQTLSKGLPLYNVRGNKSLRCHHCGHHFGHLEAMGISVSHAGEAQAWYKCANCMSLVFASNVLLLTSEEYESHRFPRQEDETEFQTRIAGEKEIEERQEYERLKQKYASCTSTNARKTTQAPLDLPTVAERRASEIRTGIDCYRQQLKNAQQLKNEVTDRITKEVTTKIDDLMPPSKVAAVALATNMLHRVLNALAGVAIAPYNAPLKINTDICVFAGGVNRYALIYYYMEADRRVFSHYDLDVGRW